MRRPSIEEIFKYHPPQGSFKGVLCSPHSGELIPQEFLNYLEDDPRALLEDVDYRVHELIDIEALQNAGIGVLVSNVQRVCVDLNRNPQQCVLYWQQNTKGIKLVHTNPTQAEIEKITAQYHKSYYEMLRSLLEFLVKNKKGLVTSIDLHSMPSGPTQYHLKKNPDQQLYRADFCLSDLHGSSCELGFMHFVRDYLTKNNFDVAINRPYFGGYGTQFMNQFHTNCMQVEINRRIYMDEDKKELIPEKVKVLRPILTQLFIDLYTKFDSEMIT